jgi:hypothetical protein
MFARPSAATPTAPSHVSRSSGRSGADGESIGSTRGLRVDRSVGVSDSRTARVLTGGGFEANKASAGWRPGDLLAIIAARLYPTSLPRIFVPSSIEALIVRINPRVDRHDRTRSEIGTPEPPPSGEGYFPVAASPSTRRPDL